jgi:hypothetical protein
MVPKITTKQYRENISSNMQETFYVKRGKKYIPVSEYDVEVHDSIRHGTHLVINHLGCRMYVYDVEPDNAAMIAAIRIFKEYLVKSLHHASEARPKTGNRTAFTESQMKAYNKLKEELGEHTYYFEFASLNDIAEQAIDNFIEHYGEKYKEYPFVKKAYDNLLLKCKMCIDNQD